MTTETKAELTRIELGEMTDQTKQLDGVPLETAYVGLTKWQALRKFWRAGLFCFCASLAALSDGFQFNLPGGSSIRRVLNTGGVISNAGFHQSIRNRRLRHGRPESQRSIRLGVVRSGEPLARISLTPGVCVPIHRSAYGRIHCGPIRTEEVAVPLDHHLHSGGSTG